MAMTKLKSLDGKYYSRLNEICIRAKLYGHDPIVTTYGIESDGRKQANVIEALIARELIAPVYGPSTDGTVSPANRKYAVNSDKNLAGLRMLYGGKEPRPALSTMHRYWTVPDYCHTDEIAKDASLIGVPFDKLTSAEQVWALDHADQYTWFFVGFQNKAVEWTVGTPPPDERSGSQPHLCDDALRTAVMAKRRDAMITDALDRKGVEYALRNLLALDDETVAAWQSLGYSEMWSMAGEQEPATKQGSNLGDWSNAADERVNRAEAMLVEAQRKLTIARGVQAAVRVMGGWERLAAETLDATRAAVDKKLGGNS